MKVGVFFSGALDEPVLVALRICRREGILASAYRLRDHWRDADLNEISFNFGSLSHIVLRASPALLGSDWMPLVAGFAAGRERNLRLLGPVAEDVVPGFLDELGVLTGEDDLTEYLRSERLLNQRRNDLEAARDEIRAAGLPETESAFAGAASSGDVALVDNFLKIGFSPDVTDAKGVPVLVLATRNAHKRVAEMLLARGADANATSADRGTTALMEAASLGDQGLLGTILSSGADPDVQSKSGRTALMLAVSEGKGEIAQALLDGGARRDLVDELGMTALSYAKLFKLEDLFAEPTDATSQA